MRKLFFLVIMALFVVMSAPQYAVCADNQQTTTVTADQPAQPQAQSATVPSEGDQAVVTQTEQKAAVATEDELPPEGASFWVWIKWLIAIIGVPTIIRAFFRLIPSAISPDIIEWLIVFINNLFGAWIPNKAKGGGVFKLRIKRE